MIFIKSWGYHFHWPSTAFDGINAPRGPSFNHVEDPTEAKHWLVRRQPRYLFYITIFTKKRLLINLGMKFALQKNWHSISDSFKISFKATEFNFSEQSGWSFSESMAHPLISWWYGWWGFAKPLWQEFAGKNSGYIYFWPWVPFGQLWTTIRQEDAIWYW